MTTKFIVITMTALCCASCHSSRSSSTQHLQSVAASTLAEHHFAPPTVVQGARGVVWIVAARPYSDASVDVARVELPTDGHAAVHVQTYQYAGSAWAELGRLFTQGRGESEAAAMEAAIHDKVSRWSDGGMSGTAPPP